VATIASSVKPLPFDPTKERRRTEFVALGEAEGGGSGRVLLTWSPRDRRLIHAWVADDTTTLAGGQPILALDMYEHAYSHGLRRQGRRL
jgi:superoxide dismutase